MATASLINSKRSERLKISRIIPHLCGMPKRLREKRIVVALRGFFDESAISPKDGSFLIMAGYVGTVGEFEKASDSWQECLDESPAITYYHHKEPKGAGKMLSLAKVVRNHDLQGFIITIPHAPFRNRDSRVSKSLIGTRIYDWAFIHTVVNVLEWVDENFPDGEKVDFIFENRNELKLCRKKLYDPLSAEGIGAWKRAGTCTPEEDKKVAALQMGDLLAGESLESIRVGKYSAGIVELARAKPILLFNRRPPDVIERALTLHNLGKKIFDAGRKKIMDSPRDHVDPAVFEKEYQALVAISAIAMKDGAMLKREMEELDEDETSVS